MKSDKRKITRKFHAAGTRFLAGDIVIIEDELLSVTHIYQACSEDERNLTLSVYKADVEALNFIFSNSKRIKND